MSLSAEPQFDRLGGRGEGCNTRCPCWRRRLISAAHFAGPSACLNLAPERLSHPTMMCSRWAPTTHTSIRQTGQETWIPQHMSLPHTAGATISRAQAVHTVCFASGKLFGQLLSCEAGFASMQTQHSTQPSPSDITLPRGGGPVPTRFCRKGPAAQCYRPLRADAMVSSCAEQLDLRCFSWCLL